MKLSFVLQKFFPDSEFPEVCYNCKIPNMVFHKDLEQEVSWLCETMALHGVMCETISVKESTRLNSNLEY